MAQAIEGCRRRACSIELQCCLKIFDCPVNKKLERDKLVSRRREMNLLAIPEMIGGQIGRILCRDHLPRDWLHLVQLIDNCNFRVAELWEDAGALKWLGIHTGQQCDALLGYLQRDRCRLRNIRSTINRSDRDRNFLSCLET